MGTIADLSLALELDPKNTGVYISRANTKLKLKEVLQKNKLEDYKRAIINYTKSIMFDSTNTHEYSERGIAKENIKDFEGACEDWRKAASQGHYASAQWVKGSCN